MSEPETGLMDGEDSGSEEDRISIIGLGAFIVSAFLGGIIATGIMSLVILIAMYQVSSQMFLYGLLTVGVYSVVMTQDMLKRDYDTDVDSRLEKLVAVITNLFHMNIMVAVTAILASGFGSIYGPIVGAITVVILSFWEVETRARAYPVSVGGIFIWCLALLILLRRGGQHLAEMIQEIPATNPAAHVIIDAPERASTKFFANKFLR